MLQLVRNERVTSSEIGTQLNGLGHIRMQPKRLGRNWDANSVHITYFVISGEFIKPVN